MACFIIYHNTYKNEITENKIPNATKKPAAVIL